MIGIPGTKAKNTAQRVVFWILFTLFMVFIVYVLVKNLVSH